MHVIRAFLVCALVAEISALTQLSVRRLSCQSIRLKNGRVRYRQKSGFAQFMCNKSFLLAGEKYMKCTHGKWEGVLPVCVKSTCKPAAEPQNGFVYPSHRGGVLNFFCKARYQLKGSPVAYCDGEKWSTYLPSCIQTTRNASLTCDFENKDLCGWSHDINHDFDWTRMKNNTPSWHIGTGPSYDHTLGETGEGYYMYIESTSRNINDTARLISPVYEKQENNTCLEFYYHMYGTTMGELRVYMKKVKDSWALPSNEAVVTISGNQGNIWKRSIINLGTIDDEFQIIMEGVRGSSYLSDVAIDDVSLIENCLDEFEESTSMSSSSLSPSEEPFYYDTCRSRCHMENTNYERCDCDNTCFMTGTCCPDYIAICLLNNSTFSDFTETSESEEIVATSELDATTEESTTEGTTPEIDTTPRPTTTVKIPPKTTQTRKLTTTVKILPKITQTRKPTTAVKILLKTTHRPKQTTAVKILPKTTQSPGPTISPEEPKRINEIVSSKPSETTTNIIVKAQPNEPITKIIFSKHPTFHTFNRTIFRMGRTRSTLQPLIPILRPNYKHNYNNNKSFKDKERDYFNNDMLTVGPSAVDEESFEIFSTEEPKKEVSLLRTDRRSEKIVEAVQSSSSVLTFVLLGMGLLGVGLVSAVCLVKRGYSCGRLRRGRNGSHGDSQSDVRFLTNDEVLDFTLATPY